MAHLNRVSRASLGLLGVTFALASSGLAQRGGNNSPILPDATKTPGDTLEVTKADICVRGYSKNVRNVPTSVKNQVYASYGITHRSPGEYEVDHLISLELGGSNSVRNLWPQSYKTSPWNAHVKDALENRLHADVCSGKIDLKVAQADIARDWIASYKRVFNTALPVSSRGTRQTRPQPRAVPKGETGKGFTAPSKPNDVWVNLKSGKYFKQGARNYGRTKSGQYMTEAEAKQAGYSKAKGQ